MKHIGQKKNNEKHQRNERKASHHNRNTPKRNQHAKQTNIHKETILGNAVQSREQQEESGYSACENVFISSAFETVRNSF